jgi:hypothetical protein
MWWYPTTLLHSVITQNINHILKVRHSDYCCEGLPTSVKITAVPSCSAVGTRVVTSCDWKGDKFMCYFCAHKCWLLEICTRICICLRFRESTGSSRMCCITMNAKCLCILLWITLGKKRKVFHSSQWLLCFQLWCSDIKYTFTEHSCWQDCFIEQHVVFLNFVLFIWTLLL